MGLRWRGDRPAGMEAGERIFALWLGRLQRGRYSLCSGLGVAFAPPAGRQLASWTATYQWENIYDYEFLYAGPLFIHHFSHAWIDFAGIRDRFMREKDQRLFRKQPTRHLSAA